MEIKKFVFSPFMENTYVISNEKKECLIIDPGCYDANEQQTLENYITENGLIPTLLLNTHCHLDHVFGNAFVIEKYKVPFAMHRLDLPTLAMGERSAMMYGLNLTPSPEPTQFLEEGHVVELGEIKLKVIFVPGHAPGHIVFYNKDEGYVVNGDVLFQESIGRTDLPGGDHATLLKNIKEKMYKLPDETLVYCGHGEETTIGHEKKYNPFVRG